MLPGHRNLNEQIKRLDSNRVDQYLHLHTQLSSLQEQIQASKLEISELEKTSRQLEDVKFHRLTRALEDINRELRTVYRTLYPQGDCYIDYAPDPVCLARQGLQMMVNPDGSKWREVKMLSGGQQAGCGIAVRQANRHWMLEHDANLTD